MNPPDKISHLLQKFDSLCSPSSIRVSPSDLVSNEDHSVSKSLVIKIHTDLPTRLTGIRESLLAAWKPKGHLLIKEYGDNLYLASFAMLEDLEKTIRGGPWNHGQDFVLLQRCRDLTPPSAYSFQTFDIWAHIHGIPVELISEVNLRHIVAPFATLRRLANDDVSKWGKYVRVKLTLKLDSPLVGCIGFPLPHAPDYSLTVQYEKLHRFCKFCGRIGHDNRSCNFLDELESAIEDDQTPSDLKALLQERRVDHFGDSLKSPPPKPRQSNLDHRPLRRGPSESPPKPTSETLTQPTITAVHNPIPESMQIQRLSATPKSLAKPFNTDPAVIPPTANQSTNPPNPDPSLSAYISPDLFHIIKTVSLSSALNILNLPNQAPTNSDPSPSLSASNYHSPTNPPLKSPSIPRPAPHLTRALHVDSHLPEQTPSPLSLPAKPLLFNIGLLSSPPKKSSRKFAPSSSRRSNVIISEVISPPNPDPNNSHTLSTPSLPSHHKNSNKRHLSLEDSTNKDDTQKKRRLSGPNKNEISVEAALQPRRTQ